MQCLIATLFIRYSNMDYIFASVLQYILVWLVLISYDVACQWFVNLFQRMEKHWPQDLKPRVGTTLIPAIPKLHEPMHLQKDHQVFSLNFIHGVGLSDCECPERVWSPHNALGNSTKTQGPGSRQDVLDDHFNFWNWSKYISMGKTLIRRYKASIKDRNIQSEGHRGLTASLDNGLVGRWEQMCKDWDDDGFPKKKKNPYQSASSCTFFLFLFRTFHPKRLWRQRRRSHSRSTTHEDMSVFTQRGCPTSRAQSTQDTILMRTTAGI